VRYAGTNGKGAGAEATLQNGQVVRGKADVTVPVGPSAKPNGLLNMGVEMGPNTVTPSAGYISSQGRAVSAETTLENGKVVGGKVTGTFPIP
jgi:hypothetical protein